MKKKTDKSSAWWIPSTSSSSSSFDGAPNNDSKVWWNFSPAPPPPPPTTTNFCTSDMNLDDLSGGDGLLDLVIDDFCPPQQLMNGVGNTRSSSSSSSQSNNNNEQFMLHLPSTSYSSTTMTRSYDAIAQDHVNGTTTTVTGAIRASLCKAANFKSSFLKGTKSNTNSNDDSDKLSDISSTSSCDDGDDEDDDRGSAYSESTNDDNDNNDDDIIAQPPRTLGLIFFDFIRCIAVSANIRCINTQLMPLFVMLTTTTTTTTSSSSSIHINKQQHHSNNMDDIDIVSIAWHGRIDGTIGQCE